MSHLFDHTTIKTVSILGGGWLGMALAKHFVAKGLQVKASTTREEKLSELRALGAIAYRIKLLPEPEGDRMHEFLQSDLLISCIPPGTRQGVSESFHPTQIQYLIEEAKKAGVARILYISSTSIYPLQNTLSEAKETDEILPHSATNRAILLAEDQIRNQGFMQYCILRCGGLMGYDRVPGKYFIGKTVTTGDVPVNFVHRDDVVGVVDAVVAKNQWGQIYNVVAPLHPIRHDIYLKNAKMFGFAPPIFKEPAEPNPYKRISVQKLIGELGYRFKFPDPMDFEYTGLPTADGSAKDPHEQADLY